jgi:hypothetical protein
MSSTRKSLQRAIVVFPAIAMVVAVGCVSASSSESGAASIAKKTTTTVKRKSSSTTKPPKGNVARTALSVLASIPQMKEHPQGYKRELFKHWTDDDGDSCNTREEVLIGESQTPAQVDAYGCKVIAGDWYSEYDGLLHTDPSDLDIDHFIPLKEAWDSGAWAWSPSQRQKFANDLSDARSLIAVTAGQNRSKGDKDLSNWLPPRQEALCTYVASWVAVKAHWKLSMDPSEWGRAKNILTKNCPSATIAPWGSKTSSTKSGPVGTVAPGSSNSSSTTVPGSLPLVTPGSFCAPEGAYGIGAKNGNSYVCSKTTVTGEPYPGGRTRWRPVS